MTVRLACDSDVLSALEDTPFIFTYADLVPTRDALDALKRAHPKSLVKLIDRGLGDPSGVATAIRVTDTEPGANSVAESAAKMQAWLKEGRSFVTGYADRDTMPKLMDAMSGHSGWWKWWATLDGTMTIPGHENNMVQFASAALVGRHVDMSVIWNGAYHPGVG